MDAVETSTGSIDTSSNGTLAIDCSAPVQQDGCIPACLPGDICCPIGPNGGICVPIQVFTWTGTC